MLLDVSKQSCSAESSSSSALIESVSKTVRRIMSQAPFDVGSRGYSPYEKRMADIILFGRAPTTTPTFSAW